MSEVARMPWFQRTFPASLPPSVFPTLVERLRGAPARMAEDARNTPHEIATAHAGSTWSIQENFGHLGDLEPLHLGRLDELLRGADVLRAADLENRATHAAGHDRARITDLVACFRSLRGAFVSRLRGLSSADLERKARHPRLGQPMGVVELCHFIAEHDDHHLGRAADLAEALRPGLTFTVVPFAREWQDRVTAFVLGIQNDEFALGLTVADQPQLGAIESAFAGSGGAFWLALSPGGELVGTAGLERLSTEDGVVRKMFVHAGWRGRKPGIARRLMDEVLTCARRLGLRRLLLDTPLHALAARRLYESHGFRERSAAGLPPGCHFVVQASRIYELLLR